MEMNKWTPKTNEDFPNINALIEELNKPMVENFDGEVFTSDSPWDLSLKINVDEANGINTVEIIDLNEELYYGGFKFEKTMERIDEALRKDVDDKNAYFDCVCPGRWLADFEGRDRYTMEMIKSSIHCGVYEAICDYMFSNDAHPNWGENKKFVFEIDSKIDEIINVIKEVFASGL